MGPAYAARELPGRALRDLDGSPRDGSGSDRRYARAPIARHIPVRRIPPKDADTLHSRLWATGQGVETKPESELRAQTGAQESDVLPGLVAGRLSWVHGSGTAAVGRKMFAGHTPAEVSREILELIDEMEELPRERVLRYAVRLT